MKKYKAGDEFRGAVLPTEYPFTLRIVLVRAHDYAVKYAYDRSPNSWGECTLKEHFIDEYLANYEIYNSPLMKALR